MQVFSWSHSPSATWPSRSAVEYRGGTRGGSCSARRPVWRTSKSTCIFFSPTGYLNYRFIVELDSTSSRPCTTLCTRLMLNHCFKCIILSDNLCRKFHLIFQERCKHIFDWFKRCAKLDLKWFRRNALNTRVVKRALVHILAGKA